MKITLTLTVPTHPALPVTQTGQELTTLPQVKAFLRDLDAAADAYEDADIDRLFLLGEALEYLCQGADRLQKRPLTP